MILLDTNVVSDGLKIHPNPKVQAWIDSHDSAPLCISAITVAELRAGMEQLAGGKKKAGLRAAIDKAIEEFNGLCLPFDGLAAYEFGAIIAARRKIGRPIGILDAQIAAIAFSAGLTLATLNKKDFEDIDGLTVVDPSA